MPSYADVQKLLADLRSGTVQWANLSPEIQSTLSTYLMEHPEEQQGLNGPSGGASSGAPSNQDLIDAINAAGTAAAAAAAPVDPVLSAAQSYYFQLYGLEAPKGMLEKMVNSGLDLYAIQNQLLSGAAKSGAPGYDDIRYANLLGQGNALYFKLWGEDPPPSAVKSMVDQGLNLFQMEQSWRADPTFKNTRTYRDEESQYASGVANLLGTR